MDTPLNPTSGQQTALLLGLVILWLCPFWLDPTPSVPPLLWGGACLGWLLLISPPAPQRAPPSLTWLLALLGSMIALRSTSLPNTLAAFLCLAGIGLAATIARSLHRQRLAEVMAWGWLLAGLANAALALAQYLGATPEPVGTAFGFLRQRNQMATLCTLALAALLYLDHSRRNVGLFGVVLWHKLAAAIAACVLCAALAATCSRTGLLQLSFLMLATCAVSTYTSGAQRRHLLIAALLLGIGYAIAAGLLPLLGGSTETVMTRVFGVAHNAAASGTAALEVQLQDSRRLLWHNAIQLIWQQPWLGVGWRELAFSLNMSDFGAAARFPVQADHTHNFVLQLAVELGLPFTVLWCSLLAVWLYRRLPKQGAAPHLLLAWAVLALIGIHSLLEYPLWYAPFQIALGLALGLVNAQDAERRGWIPAFAGMTDKPGITGKAGITVKAGVAKRAELVHEAKVVQKVCVPLRGVMAMKSLGTGLIFFCIYAAFDYHRVSQLFIPADQRFALYQTNTMSKVEGSWLFASQVRFAKLLMMTVTADNAKDAWQLGQQVIHFSPEPRVFKVLIAAGSLLASHDPIIEQQLVVLQRQLADIQR